MKTNAFAYHRATSVENALTAFALAGPDARFLAGGQSLMASLNFRLDEPPALIDISRLDALRGIEIDTNTITIKAMTRHAEVAGHAGLARTAPLIAEAIQHVAHPAIRNRGTFGGSIALADPAAEMPACILALGGTIHLAGATGARTVLADDFFLGSYETALQPGELLTRVEIPVPAAGSQHGFAELARRHGDYAMAGLCLMLGPDKGTARAVFFGISDRPVRSPAAEAAIITGAPPAEVAALATEGVEVFGDLNATEATKRHLASVLLRRELERLNGQKELAA